MSGRSCGSAIAERPTLITATTKSAHRKHGWLAIRTTGAATANAILSTRKAIGSVNATGCANFAHRR